MIQNKTIAYGILARADRARYGKLIEEVEYDFLKGSWWLPEKSDRGLQSTG
jgi:hypothetical protein